MEIVAVVEEGGFYAVFDNETLHALSQRARLAMARGDRDEWKMLARIMFAVAKHGQ